MTKSVNNSIPPGFWVALVIAIALIFAVQCTKSNAQTKKPVVIDTMECKVECIDRFVEEPTKSGNIKVHAVYRDEKGNILDIIPVSNSVYNYIKLCSQYGIEPQVAIELRNHQIYRLIKYKPKYYRRNKK